MSVFEIYFLGTTLPTGHQWLKIDLTLLPEFMVQLNKDDGADSKPWPQGRYQQSSRGEKGTSRAGESSSEVTISRKTRSRNGLLRKKQNKNANQTKTEYHLRVVNAMGRWGGRDHVFRWGRRQRQGQTFPKMGKHSPWMHSRYFILSYFSLCLVCVYVHKNRELP